MQGMGDIFRRFDEFLLFDIPQHFGRRFGARRQHKVVGQAVDNFFLPVLLDDIGRGNQGHGTGGGGGPQPGAHLAFGIRLEQVAVHVVGATAHDVTGHDIFRHRGFHKAGRRIDFDFARFHVGFIDHAAHAAVVVNVAVGVDNRHDRFFTAVFIVQIHPHFRRFGGNQRVNHGNPFFPFDDGHVGQVEVTNLVHAVGDFKQTADVDQLRLAPQARVNGIRRFFSLFNEGVLLRIPDHVALLAFDDLGRQGGDKAFVGVGEIGVIGERELIIQCVIRLLCCCCCLSRCNLSPGGKGNGR